MTDETSLVYVGLGGNIGNPLQTLHQAAQTIGNLPGVTHLQLSKIYITSPVSSIPQEDYLNAVCRFRTHLSVDELLLQLQAIERSLGKYPKEKSEARSIDLDILFFGKFWIQTEQIEIPHPRWKERLFVLIPLCDLADEVLVPTSTSHNSLINLRELLSTSHFPHQTIELFSTFDLGE